MKIAVNLLPIRKKVAGAGKYAQNIVFEMSRQDHKNEYYLYVSKHGKKNFEIESPNFHFIVPKFNPESVLSRIFWEQVIFPIKLMKLKPDIIFTPTVAIPFLFSGVFFTSIHDLAYKNVKNKYSFLRNIYVRFVTTIAAKKSKIIFALTDFSKNEFLKEFNLRNKKVLVTYTGVHKNFFVEFAENQKSDFMKKYNLPELFILYVGAIEPGKNLDKLFLAFYELAKENGNIRLVLTSGVGWEQGELNKLIIELEIKEKILLLPYISENELPLLYRCASMLTYLSSYEGFGMPVLEAMAAGTPIISSRSEAINEFAAEAILAIDPNNINDIVSGMKRILNDEKYRTSIVKTGKIKAQNFKWANSAKIILKEIDSFKSNV